MSKAEIRLRQEAHKEHIQHVKRVLDFVERWNKQDEDKDVAESAQYLLDTITDKNSYDYPVCENCGLPGESKDHLGCCCSAHSWGEFSDKDCEKAAKLANESYGKSPIAQALQNDGAPESALEGLDRVYRTIKEHAYD